MLETHKIQENIEATIAKAEELRATVVTRIATVNGGISSFDLEALVEVNAELTVAHQVKKAIEFHTNKGSDEDTIAERVRELVLGRIIGALKPRSSSNQSNELEFAIHFAWSAFAERNYIV